MITSLSIFDFLCQGGHRRNRLQCSLRQGLFMLGPYRLGGLLLSYLIPRLFALPPLGFWWLPGFGFSAFETHRLERLLVPVTLSHCVLCLVWPGAAQCYYATPCLLARAPVQLPGALRSGGKTEDRTEDRDRATGSKHHSTIHFHPIYRGGVHSFRIH